VQSILERGVSSRWETSCERVWDVGREINMSFELAEGLELSVVVDVVVRETTEVTADDDDGDLEDDDDDADFLVVLLTISPP
jgi:hypothetical protein